MSIINNVGYPTPNRLHFRSSEYLNIGWLGRYIEKYGKIPQAKIELDDSLSLIMKVENINGIATRDPRILFANS